MQINSGEVKHGTPPETGINIARDCVKDYRRTAASVKSEAHVSLWGYVYITTFRAQSKGRTDATRAVAWATGSAHFPVTGFEVPSVLSEPTGTPQCFWWKLACCWSVCTTILQHYDSVTFFDCNMMVLTYIQINAPIINRHTSLRLSCHLIMWSKTITLKIWIDPSIVRYHVSQYIRTQLQLGHFATPMVESFE